MSTTRIEELYASYLADRRNLPRRRSDIQDEDTFLAVLVFTMREIEGEKRIDFDRDREGRIVGVRGLRLREPSDP